MQTFNSHILRIVLFLFVSICGLTSFAQTNESEINQYFYPLPQSTYSQPGSKIEELYEWYGDGLLKVTFIPDQLGKVRIYKVYYKISNDIKNNQIVSTEQLGMGESQDKLILFALPHRSGPRTWTRTWKENENGKVSTYTSKYVYISYYVNGNQRQNVAVKIEKTTPLNSKSSVKEWSYWVRGMGRIATYGVWGNDSKSPTAISISTDIDTEYPVEETTTIP
ncbi:MAG: hypothetical protein HDS53_07070 [Barnesiella sp.]|nr:hypothetical protein [Barnesiella sp.]